MLLDLLYTSFKPNPSLPAHHPHKKKKKTWPSLDLDRELSGIVESSLGLLWRSTQKVRAIRPSQLPHPPTTGAFACAFQVAKASNSTGSWRVKEGDV